MIRKTQKEEEVKILKKEYEDKVETRSTHSVDSFLQWKNQTPEAVVRELVEEKKISTL